ncbi:MAG: alpha/beta hydrolase fold domain-containing protein, partial [Candidatus Thermoplasmatota archaeon]|nr:alpha/beta hydrolase fold domain-containing protein [Candidatus Thermoplasmatota archaeon]
MPLNPDVTRLLKMFESNQPPDIWKTDIREFRKRAEQSPLPKKVEKVEDVKDMEFEHHGIKIPVRLYTPENAGKGMIIYYHGGGLVFGNINTHDDICRMAANRSRTRVLSVDYRLAPENKFPFLELNA